MSSMFSTTTARQPGKTTLIETQLIQLAAYVSVAAHTAVGQKSKYTGDPYWMHCHSVAQRVLNAGGTVDQICAAYLHDTVEDTHISSEDIGVLFGPNIRALVDGLTDVSTPAGDNRITRRTLDRLHTAIQSPEVKLIKLCDMLDNLESVFAHDVKFGQVYWVEASLLLPHLQIDNPMYDKVEVYLEAAKVNHGFDNIKSTALLCQHLETERRITGGQI